ncbi:MAG: hypothetical protein HYX89_08115 [Chloroflexi bacterium]|nr:hypothetical protein [Chloroflexota bacterium]
MVVNAFRLVVGVLFAGLAFMVQLTIAAETANPFSGLPLTPDILRLVFDVLFAAGFIFFMAGLPGRWGLSSALLLGAMIYLLSGIALVSSFVVPIVGWDGFFAVLGRPELLRAVVAWPYELLFR